MEGSYKSSTLGAAIGVIGWILFSLCCLVAAFEVLSGETTGAASAAAGAITSLILIAIGTIVQKVHSIEHYTYASYLQILEARPAAAAAGSGDAPGVPVEASTPGSPESVANLSDDKPERYSRRFPNKD